MMLLGFIWALLAPLLLIPLIAILAVLMKFTGWSRNLRIAAAVGITAVCVGYVWWIDYREFVSVCEKAGKPRIFAYGTADGIYLDSPTANSFGMNYLHQQGFAWMEMRSIYDRKKFERVTREPDGQFRTEPVDTVSADYEVRETFEQPYPHTGLSMKRVLDRRTGMLMAQAGSATFNGGRVHWVLGVYGSRSYPGARKYSDDFRGYYYLAQHTLRPEAKGK